MNYAAGSLFCYRGSRERLHSLLSPLMGHYALGEFNLSGYPAAAGKAGREAGGKKCMNNNFPVITFSQPFNRSDSFQSYFHFNGRVKSQAIIPYLVCSPLSPFNLGREKERERNVKDLLKERGIKEGRSLDPLIGLLGFPPSPPGAHLSSWNFTPACRRTQGSVPGISS